MSGFACVVAEANLTEQGVERRRWLFLMKHECIDLEEQIERCERLAQSLTDEKMRQALGELAEDYKARLGRMKDRPFMLADGAPRRSSGGSAAGAR